MVHYVFWLFSGGAPASQPARGGGGEGGGFPKPPSHPAAARRSSYVPKNGMNDEDLRCFWPVFAPFKFVVQYPYGS